MKPTVRAVCAALFLLFTFAWMYFFQADMLAVAQHGLSGGKTHYERTAGALIVTGVLFALQLLVYALIRLSRRTHALTYLPSFLLLGFVSGLHFPFQWGAWLWAGPLVLLLWGGAVWLARKACPFDNDAKEPTGLLSPRLWLNLLQMAAMMLGVAAVSDTNAVNHFKARAEVALLKGDTEGALQAGCRSLETDETLTMLRIFALSCQGQLADRLFEYPIRGTGNDMLPLRGSKARLALLPDTIVWDHFGQRPDTILARADSLSRLTYSERLTTRTFLDSLEKDTLATTACVDYRLMGMLIDRQLDSFVVSLPCYYPLNPDSLPRHYREALVLYRAQCDTSFIYSDSLLTSGWQRFLQLDSLYPRASERLVRTDDSLRVTYWYYYHQVH